MFMIVIHDRQEEGFCRWTEGVHGEFETVERAADFIRRNPDEIVRNFGRDSKIWILPTAAHFIVHARDLVEYNVEDLRE